MLTDSDRIALEVPRDRQSSLDFVAWKDHRAVVTALKEIYRAVDSARWRRSKPPLGRAIWLPSMN